MSADYILPTERYNTPADYILSFDLAGEEWRRVLHGPSSTGNLTSGQMVRSELTLADLKGSLVLAHHPRSLSVMDLWFLLDFESRLWVKQYSIRIESVTSSLAAGYHLIPLLELDDGRLVIHLAPTGLLFICDPATNTFTRVNIRHHLDSVGVYTGSLLS
ncbi:unnamed protein product [Miscanthus lutarioriparius]|uniref:F-box associated domain-containing protein n=1 Tax=Miscanthus lutarioriparius TaxID=422564 RepID=A0A811NMA8_9POAL|nr:unnamed protein product [Miscanthus lutarioriparius]